MKRKSIVSINTIGAIEVPPNSDVKTVFYEAGAVQLLRNMARRELRVGHEHIGPEYDKFADASDAFVRLRDDLQLKIPEKYRDELATLDRAVELLELESLDAGFVAGFVAGYRFLKEMNPE